MSEMENLIEKYFRPGRLPHIWCPGCGNGVITGAIVKAIDKQGLAKDDVALISGIGCSSRSSGYLDFNTANTLHGRALTIATGVKMANPALNVIVCSGDGDCTAIGGNHLIHACRRNINMTLVVYNNSIFTKLCSFICIVVVNYQNTSIDVIKCFVKFKIVCT